jgi:acetoin:2,6-dichlorophenolindophenol oxidoreductase subunit beta
MADEQGLDQDRLVWMFTQMLRIREFEERVKRSFTELPGLLRGHTHLADGAEASIVGSLAALRPGDQILTTYRCHGYPIVLGTDPKAMMAEIFGKRTGLCGGYGGSMHLTDVARGFLGTSGIVGQGIPQATGAAYAAQIAGKGQVVLCFFGDGAAKQGAFHESLNIASLWKLPIVYVMENNSYNVVTRVEQEDANAAAGEPLSVKARAYSMPGVTVGGGDPVAVYGEVVAAAARARGGSGPTLVESKVYRLSAHVRVTPISETAEIGMAVGAALAGYRPVVELYMAEFILVAMDQVVNEAPRFRYMSGGQVKLPLVLKAGYGFTAGWAGQHTGSIYGMFMGVPGLKIALPATAADAKGLMATAIRDDNPVVFFHHYLLTLAPGEVPEGEHLVPFGSADIRRPGGDVTIVATGWMVHRALTAAERLAGEGVSAEVIDPRTLAPLDTATVIESVSKTGHLVLVDQATRRASASAVIAAEVADAGFGYLKAPIKQVTGLDTPIPYSKPMEEHVLPNEDKIVEAVRQVLSTTLVT